jgi:two-component system chemotaxis response regulator CheB
LRDLFEELPDVAVVGEASTGDEAVRLSRELRPDVITMDYHMPGKNGIEATAEIMLGDRPLPHIIIVSAFAGPDGAAVRRSLVGSGASLVVKPSGEVSLDMERVSKEVIERVRSAGVAQRRIRNAVEEIERSVGNRDTRAHSTASSGGVQASFGAVVIGASTGGPPLVEHILSSLSPSDGVAFLIAQHMSEYFTELFAERLSRVTPFSVRTLQNGDRLAPGVALVIPGGRRIALADDPESDHPHLELTDELAGAHGGSEIDDAMTALAGCAGSRAIGVLLSGMGQDGALGLRAIKSFGGHTIVQDPEEAAVRAMPDHAIAERVADEVLPMSEIARAIRERCAVIRSESGTMKA